MKMMNMGEFEYQHRYVLHFCAHPSTTKFNKFNQTEEHHSAEPRHSFPVGHVEGRQIPSNGALQEFAEYGKCGA